MTAFVTGPLLALGTGAVMAAVSLESAFTDVIKTVDATEAEIEKLREGFREMSRELPLTTEEIYAIGSAAGQLGIETENILSFTEVMAKLGVTTNMSSDQAATALARLANITQMPQSQFDRLGATVVALGNNLATTESEIVEMGLRLAGAGKQVGMTEAQILSFAGALSSVGIEAQAGGTAFSKVMVQMQLAAEKGGQGLVNFANVAGMSAEDFKRAFEENAAGAIIAFIEGLSTAEERGASAIKVLDDMGITEVRLRDALLRASGASDLFNKSIELGSKAWDENIALNKEAELRFGTAASQLQLFKNEIKLTAAAFGEELIPVLLEILDAIKPYIKAFGEMDSEQKKQIITLGAIAAAAGPVLIVLGGIITGAGKLIGILPLVSKGLIAPVYGVRVLRLGLGALGAVLGTTAAAAGAIVAVIAGVGVAASALSTKVRELTEGFGPRLQQAMTMGSGALLGPVGAITSIIKNFDLLVDVAREDIDMAVGFFQSLPENVGMIVQSVGDWFSSLPGRIGEGLSAAGAFLLKFFTEDLPYWTGYAIGAMIRFFIDLPGNILEHLTALAEALAEWAPIAWDWAKETGSRMVTNFINYMKELPGNVWTWLVETANKIPDWAGELYVKAKNAAGELIRGMIDKLKELPGDIVDILWEAAKKLLDIGKTFYNYAKRAAKNAWEGFKDGLGISSPSYIEQALIAIEETAKNTIGTLQHEFGSLSDMQMPVNLAVAGAGAIPGQAQPSVSKTYTFSPTFNSPERQSHAEQQREFEKWTQEVALGSLFD
ncbi:MAG: phage tail tape measure protein [Kiritimatiellae bacterium]|nr:phage tail tape measure protein [Kiritimatiellia bacterium]